MPFRCLRDPIHRWGATIRTVFAHPTQGAPVSSGGGLPERFPPHSRRAIQPMDEAEAPMPLSRRTTAKIWSNNPARANKEASRG